MPNTSGVKSGILTVVAMIGSLIFLYLLVSNPKGVTALAQTTGGFVTTESKILQGR
ncbi:MAG TPA: hypothetical protein VID72_10360 [Ktedonobacterales bacterium]|jgi:hypothetical protein